MQDRDDIRPVVLIQKLQELINEAKEEGSAGDIEEIEPKEKTPQIPAAAQSEMDQANVPGAQVDSAKSFIFEPLDPQPSQLSKSSAPHRYLHSQTVPVYQFGGIQQGFWQQPPAKISSQFASPTESSNAPCTYQDAMVGVIKDLHSEKAHKETETKQQVTQTSLSREMFEVYQLYMKGVLDELKPSILEALKVYVAGLTGEQVLSLLRNPKERAELTAKLILFRGRWLPDGIIGAQLKLLEKESKALFASSDSAVTQELANLIIADYIEKLSRLDTLIGIEYIGPEGVETAKVVLREQLQETIATDKRVEDFLTDFWAIWLEPSVEEMIGRGFHTVLATCVDRAIKSLCAHESKKLSAEEYIHFISEFMTVDLNGLQISDEPPDLLHLLHCIFPAINFSPFPYDFPVDSFVKIDSIEELKLCLSTPAHGTHFREESWRKLLQVYPQLRTYINRFAKETHSKLMNALAASPARSEEKDLPYKLIKLYYLQLKKESDLRQLQLTHEIELKLARICEIFELAKGVAMELKQPAIITDQLLGHLIPEIIWQEILLKKWGNIDKVITNTLLNYHTKLQEKVKTLHEQLSQVDIKEAAVQQLASRPLVQCTVSLEGITKLEQQEQFLQLLLYRCFSNTPEKSRRFH